MAIVKMKRLTLLAMKDDREKLLQAMQRMACVQVTDMPKELAPYAQEGDRRAGELEMQLQRVDGALARLKPYDTYFIKPAFCPQPSVAVDEAERVYDARDEVLAAVGRVEAADARLSELRAMQSRAEAGIAQYTPWMNLDAPPAALQNTRDTVFWAGAMPARKVALLEEALGELPAACQVVSSQGENACVLIAANRACAKEARAAFEPLEFTQEGFAALDDATPAQYVARLEAQLGDIQTERVAVEASYQDMAQDIPRMKILHAVLSAQLKRCRAAANFAATGSTFLMTGWVPENMTDKLTKRLTALFASVVIEYEDPRQDEEPPVLLRNGKFARVFEPIVEGYSLPAYRSYDPTAVMAPFYAVLFGLMLSDAGYGLLMAVFIPIFMKVKGIRFKDAKLLYLLAIGGAVTVFWGIVLNTVFGFSPIPRIGGFFPMDPIGNSLPVMALCIGVGLVHLLAGVGCAAYVNIKRGDIMGAVAGQFAWVAMLAGLGLLVLPATKSFGLILALAGAVIILLFTRRDTKNPIKRIMGGLGALYGITGWVSDLLSYMRLFGMGLATGVIGMVFNNLIGMVWGGGILGKVIAIVLFVACHAFNLGINALGAYVHSCRLQYIEFFGKFYEDGGQPFRPLDTATRYVSITAPNGEG